MMRTLIRRTLLAWANWRSRKAMRKAIPDLRELDIAHAQCRKAHRRGSARIIAAKRAAVCRALAGRDTASREVSRG